MMKRAKSAAHHSAKMKIKKIYKDDDLLSASSVSLSLDVKISSKHYNASLLALSAAE